MGTKFSDELRDFNPEDVPPYSFDSKNGYSKRHFRTMKSPRKNHRYIYSTYVFHIYIYTHTYISIFTHIYKYIYIYIHTHDLRVSHLGTDGRLFAAIPGE